jgi:type II secretory pathway pseudopilin PulG
MSKWLLRAQWKKNRAGFTLVECVVAVTLLMLISLSMMTVFHAFASLNRQAAIHADSQAKLQLAMEMIIREAREGQIVYGEKLPNAPASLVIRDNFTGRLRQVRYRMAPDASGSYSLLREVAYPGISAYHGHNPVARKIRRFEIAVQGEYLQLALEDSNAQIITQGTQLRNQQP